MGTSCKLSRHEYVAFAAIETRPAMMIWIKADRPLVPKTSISPCPPLHGGESRTGRGKADIRTLTGFAPPH